MAKKDWMIIESELDDDQMKFLMATNDKSCIVSGCAGSGKSVLALIKAQRIQKEKGDDYQIIVFTTSLCRYMNVGREDLGLHNKFYYYEEWRWKKELKQYRNGLSFMVYAKDANGNRISNMPNADYVIVDEIQDFSMTEIQEFIQATNKCFFFFGDTAQSIFNGIKQTMPVNAIQNLVPADGRIKNFHLYNNYRLPIPVAKVAQYVGINLGPFNEKNYKSTETAIPKFIHYNDLNDQIESIASIIKKRNFADVAILLYRSEDIQIVSSLLNSYGINHEVKYKDNNNWRNSIDNLNFQTSNPKVMTYHSAKGLQFETVFMPAIESLSYNVGLNISQQRALYVAMTRTYRYLYIMYSGILPAPLSNVPRTLYSTTVTEIEGMEII